MTPDDGERGPAMTAEAAEPRRTARRRDLLKGALGLGVGAALVGAVVRSEAAATVKLEKSAMQYTDKGAVKDQDCDDCVQFVAGKTAAAPGTCRIVEGPISPHGHCVAFAPKRKA